MKKVIYLANIRLPTKNAHGFQIMNMCSAFAKHNVDVELVVPHRNNLVLDDPFDFYALPRTFSIKKLPAIDLFQFRMIPEKISGFILLCSFFVSARLYLWRNTYDVIFTREKYAGLFFNNFVFEVHMPEQVVSYSLRAKKIVVLTTTAKNELVKKNINPEKILVAPDAVNLEMFPHRTKEEARKYLSINTNLPIALYWGNFKLWKGVDVLAHAVQFLPDIFVMMIGATKDTDLSRIKRIVGGRENVVVEGFKSQELLPWYLAAADVLILPNTAHDENSRLYTSPMKLFEYMAAERPIVASDLPSLRQVLTNENSLLVVPDDPHVLADGIKNIVLNHELANRFVTETNKIIKEYTWDNRAAHILNFIDISK